MAGETSAEGVSPSPSYGYMPALDGMRAVSILLVILAHFGAQKFLPGGFGVTVFFFISGFLISRQLTVEVWRTGGLSFRKFYMRRVTRLFPAMAVMIFAGAGMLKAFGAEIPLQHIVTALLYVSNYQELLYGYPAVLSNGAVFHPYVTLWSLSVEEHFYLAFPLFFLLSGRWRGYVPLLAALLVASLLWRLAVYPGCHGGPQVSFCGVLPDYRLYKATDTRADSILYGVLLTALLAGPASEKVVRRLSHPGVVLLAVVTLLFTFAWNNDAFRETWRYSLQGLAMMPVVTAVLFVPRYRLLRRLCESRLAVMIGRWSYSLYLYHSLAILLAWYLFPDHTSLAWRAVAASGTFAFALISYYGIEQPLLSLRRRYGSHV